MAPGSRPGLDAALAAPDTKSRYVRRLFATIADRYDLITRLLSFGLDQRWKRRLVDLADPKPADRVLDLACGTGDLAIGAAERGADVIGIDITPRMIELARVAGARARTAGRLSWMVGDMMALPLPRASCDCITTGYGLRNVPDLAGAIAEIHRVLKPGGRLCSLDFDRPESRLVRGVYLAYLTAVGSTIGWALHGDPDTYRYIPASIRRYPGARAVVKMLEAAGFTDVRHVPVLGGLIAIHVATRRPQGHSGGEGP
jgi:demethylmenaquinone methyltransferase/2-methoxy-6-polyprenyl-1,4-benzoquinol methylase